MLINNYFFLTANYGYMAFDENNRRARIRTDDLDSDGEPELVDTHDRPAHPLGKIFKVPVQDNDICQ